jgi:hypothetical protein
MSDPKQHGLRRKTGLAFWLIVFAVIGTCLDAIATSLLPFNLTLIAFGFLGAFLGSSPLILMPRIALVAFGADAPIGQPQHRVGQLYVLAVAGLATAVAAVRIFPHETSTGSAVSEAGIIAAILAGVFTAEFRPAALLWLRRKTRRTSTRSRSS